MAVPETAPVEGLRPIKYAEACVRAMREAADALLLIGCDAQAHAASDPIDERPFPVQSRSSDAKEPSKPDDHRGLGGVHGEKIGQDHDEHKKGGQCERTPLEQIDNVAHGAGLRSSRR